MVHALPASRPRAEVAVPAVLDIEASGFGRHSYPVEIGFVLPDGQSYCTLIRPARGWTHWDPAAQAVHGIALQKVVDHGRDVVEVARHLNDRLHGTTIYCDGWAHDFVWLSVLFEAARQSPAFKLEDLRSLLSDAEAAAWGETKQQVAAEMHLPRHRASADARVLQQTLVRLRTPLRKRRRAVSGR